MAEDEKTEEIKTEAPQEQESQEQESVQQTGRQEHQVPLRHLLKERQKAKQFEKELQSLKDELASLRESKTPDYDEDPKAYVDHKLTFLEKKGADVSKGMSEEEIQAKIDEYAVISAINADDAAARKKFPDFQNAINHVREAMYHQHLLSGLPEDEIPEVMNNAEINLAKSLLSQGRSPSEFIYEYAVSQMGYRPPKKEEAPKSDKLDALEKGKAASSPVPGGDAVSSESKPNASAFDRAMSEAFGFLKK